MSKKKLLYLRTNPIEKNIICHGVDFKGFLEYLEKPLDHLLLIKHSYDGGVLHTQSGFDYLAGSDVMKLAGENICKFGDFAWVDYRNEFALDQLTRLDIAELLYFGHTHRPFSGPVFTRLQNRFAYWSHDDGWFTSIYFADSADLLSFVAAAVSAVAQPVNMPGSKLQQDTVKEILKLSESGMLVDGGDLDDTGDMLELPFYITGKIKDMDDAINNTSNYKKKAQKRGTLRFKKTILNQQKRFSLLRPNKKRIIK